VPDLKGLRESLEVDKAISEGQLYRYWGLRLEDLGPDWSTVTRQIGLTRHSSGQVTFVCLEKRVGALEGAQLRHLAGVAEMRKMLGELPGAWESSAQRQRALLLPDALWHTKGGVVAIEFDAGSYSPKQIEEKVWGYSRNYARQVWGTPTELRRGRLEHQLKKLGAKPPRVLLTTWT
jgi:hypothetical protein